MLRGQVPGGGELVEPALGAPGGQVGDHGDQGVDVGGGRAGLLGGVLGLGERGAVRVDLGWADDVGEHGGGVRRSARGGLAGLGGVVGELGDDEQHVGVGAAGGHHVGRGAVGAGAEDAVAGAVDGAPVRGVHGGGVGEGDLLADVGGGQQQRRGELFARRPRRGR